MGGMMGGGDKSSGSSTETKEIKLPAWVDEAAQRNYAFAENVAYRPFEQYGGRTVADLSPEFWQAQGKLGGLDDYYGNYGDASTALKGLLDFKSGAITAKDVPNFTQLRVEDYLNPYIQNVERYAVDNASRQGMQAQRDLASQATKAKAFGGSRQALQQAVQGAETARTVGEISAKLRQQGYDTATGLMQKDITSQLEEARLGVQAQTANEQARAAAAGVQRGAATDLADVADQGQNARIREMAQYLGIGQMRQAQKQREYDDAKSKWQERRDYPLEQLNILLSSLGMTPYGRTETSTKTSQSESSAGGGGAGLFGALFQAIPGLMSLSDRTAKTDIEKLGHDPVLDVPLYAYRYKGDPKTYPKAVGPMAQDIEKKIPGAVRKVGGKRIIDLTRLVA